MAITASKLFLLAAFVLALLASLVAFGVPLGISDHGLGWAGLAAVALAGLMP